MGLTKCTYNYKGSGKQVFFDSGNHEIHKAMFPVQYREDFLGAWLAIPAAGAPESGCDWVDNITGAGAVAKTADQPGGEATITIDNTAAQQEGVLYHDDNRNFDITKELIFETVLDIEVLPTLGAEMQWGLGDDYVIGGYDALTYCVGFDVDGSGALNVYKDDAATSQIVSTGQTLVAGTKYVFTIVCTLPTDIKFFVDGIEAAAATVFPYTAVGANAILQPYFVGYKAGTAGVGVMNIDSVKCFQNRV